MFAGELLSVQRRKQNPQHRLQKKSKEGVDAEDEVVAADRIPQFVVVAISTVVDVQ